MSWFEKGKKEKEVTYSKGEVKQIERELGRLGDVHPHIQEELDEMLKAGHEEAEKLNEEYKKLTLELELAKKKVDSFEKDEKMEDEHAVSYFDLGKASAALKIFEEDKLGMRDKYNNIPTKTEEMPSTVENTEEEDGEKYRVGS